MDEKIGLIDGIKSFSEVLQRAFELYQIKYKTPQNQKDMDTESKNLLQKIWAKMSGTDTPKPEKDASEIIGNQEPPKDALAEILAKMNRLEERLKATEVKNAQLQAENTELKTTRQNLENQLFEGTKPKPNANEKNTVEIEKQQTEPDYSFNQLLRERYPEISAK